MSTKGVPREPTWTQAECDFLRESYVRVPVAEIAGQLGRSYESVRRKASKVGVQRKEWGEKFSPQEVGILRKHFATSTMSEMTSLLPGRHHNSIRQHAGTLGLVNPEQVKRAVIAAGVRHDYFSQIDSPVKAYVLGLMASDGHVSSGGNGIHLKVARKDIELAELVRDEISPQSAVRLYTYAPLPGYTTERKVADFAVCSAQMKADLGRLGIVPRKTFTLMWPQLEPALVAPFILGCFDGDGHLRFKGQPYNWCWTLYSASKPFLTEAHTAISQHLGLDLKRAVSKRGLHVLRLNGGKRVQVIDEWLHADVPGLSRKRLPPGANSHAEEKIHARRSEIARGRFQRGEMGIRPGSRYLVPPCENGADAQQAS